MTREAPDTAAVHRRPLAAGCVTDACRPHVRGTARAVAEADGIVRVVRVR